MTETLSDAMRRSQYDFEQTLPFPMVDTNYRQVTMERMIGACRTWAFGNAAFQVAANILDRCAEIITCVRLTILGFAVLYAAAQITEELLPAVPSFVRGLADISVDDFSKTVKGVLEVIHIPSVILTGGHFFYLLLEELISKDTLSATVESIQRYKALGSRAITLCLPNWGSASFSAVDLAAGALYVLTSCDAIQELCGLTPWDVILSADFMRPFIKEAEETIFQTYTADLSPDMNANTWPSGRSAGGDRSVER